MIDVEQAKAGRAPGDVQDGAEIMIGEHMRVKENEDGKVWMKTADGNDEEEFDFPRVRRLHKWARQNPDKLGNLTVDEFMMAYVLRKAKPEEKDVEGEETADQGDFPAIAKRYEQLFSNNKSVLIDLEEKVRESKFDWTKMEEDLGLEADES